MANVYAILLSFILVAQAGAETVQVSPETTPQEFQSWFIEASTNKTSVQFEFVNLQKQFNPFDQIINELDPNKFRGDVYFLIGDLTNAWSEEEYVAYFPVAKWLSTNGFRAIINPAAVIKDVRDAVKSIDVRGIIWSSHGSEDGEIFDKNDQALPRNIFSYKASPRLRHFVLGDCYGERVANFYSFPAEAGVHHWVGEITSDDFFNYLKSSKWRRDFTADLRIKAKK